MAGLTSASMRHNPSEKREIIHLVEHSALPVKKTLAELGIPKSTFSRRTSGRCIAGTAGIKKKVRQA